MLDVLAFSWLLLPLGVALGWYLARGRGHGPSRPPMEPDYLSGLSHLINEDPDQAVAALVRASEADPRTAELQLTLGSLFRRRGEVDRALRVHQNLLQRSDLPVSVLQQARYELALDYLKAGVMDRAEEILAELVQHGQFLPGSLEQLLSIHEQAREWDKAIVAAERLEPLKGQSLRPLMAHYLCEQAEEARRAGNPELARRCATRALSTDPGSVRASLLQGQLREAENDPSGALKHYRRVPEQDPRFLGEAIAALRRCHESLQDLSGLRRYLREAEARWTHPAPVLEQARLMLKDGEDPIGYLTESLQQLPNWQGLDLLFESLARQSEALAPTLRGLRAALRKTCETAAAYRCMQCGLTPRLLFWQCPSCKHWGSIIPEQGVLQAA